jgi:Tfp pilus assembly protein FimT
MYRQDSAKSRSRILNQQGFSIIELAVVMLFSMVLASVSLISFSSAKARYDLTTTGQTVAGKIERARSLAIRLNKTLTLSITPQTLGLTCTNCGDAKAELPSYRLPANITLSEYPTLTISSNGVIQSSAPVISLRDGKGKQLELTIKSSGRVALGDVVTN